MFIRIISKWMGSFLLNTKFVMQNEPIICLIRFALKYSKGIENIQRMLTRISMFLSFTTIRVLQLVFQVFTQLLNLFSTFSIIKLINPFSFIVIPSSPILLTLIFYLLRKKFNVTLKRNLT